MGNQSSSTNYNSNANTLERNVGSDGKISYPSSKCWEGHGGSHCSQGDILEGANKMNNFDDTDGNSILVNLVNPHGPYHAAPENIVGSCPDPSAHQE